MTKTQLIKFIINSYDCKDNNIRRTFRNRLVRLHPQQIKNLADSIGGETPSIFKELE